MNYVEGLSYDQESGRYCVDGRDIHCGDVVEIRRASKWELVRFEMSGGSWYVITDTGNDYPSERWEARWPERRGVSS